MREKAVVGGERVAAEGDHCLEVSGRNVETRYFLFQLRLCDWKREAMAWMPRGRGRKVLARR